MNHSYSLHYFGYPHQPDEWYWRHNTGAWNPCNGCPGFIPASYKPEDIKDALIAAAYCCEGDIIPYDAIVVTGLYAEAKILRMENQ